MKKCSLVVFACFCFAGAIGKNRKTVFAKLPSETNIQNANHDLLPKILTRQFVRSGSFDIVTLSKFRKVITGLNVQKSDEKIVIAILPFVTSIQGVNPDLVQEMVTKQFVKSGRFDIVDRSKFQKVISELNVQKSEEFLNSKIVDQGKLLGAQYLVTGVVTQMNSTSRDIVSTQPPYTHSKTWGHVISISYQVIDVETSKAIYSENIKAESTAAHSGSESDARDNAECFLGRNIRYAVMKEFPQEIQIVKVEKTTRKGLPDEVLISAGTNFFDADSKGNECDKGLIDKINVFKKKDVVRLAAFEIEVLTVNGKEAKREKQIGTLKLKDVQGDFSVCEVTDGAKEIQDRINSNQKILLKIL